MPRRDHAAGADDVDGSLAATLDVLEGAANYRDWILSLARPWLAGPILEVGAGQGTYTEHLLHVGEVHCVEPSDRGAGELKRRYGHDPRVQVTHGLLADVDAEPSFGSAILINVLEHIDDDAAALRQLRDRLVPGGRVILWVPAFPLLYSPFDRAIGHHRRYRRVPLLQLVSAAGFTVERAHHANLIGWFTWLAVARGLGRVPASPTMVGVWDRFALPVIRAVESRVTPPFGQSLFVVGRKPLGSVTGHSHSC